MAGEEFVELVKNKGIILREGKSNKAVIMMMVKGKVDCYFNDRISTLSEAKKLKETGIYKPGNGHEEFMEMVKLKLENGYIGWSKDSKEGYKADLVKKVDGVLKGVKESGKIQAIVDKFTK